jgi:ATP-dependent helicase/nuclease subunit B
MIRLFISASSEQRLRASSEFVGGYAPASELLLVGPNRDAIDDFARTNAGAGTFGWHRFTLPQLAKRLAAAELASRGLARATAVGAEAVAARAAFLLHKENRLPYFAPVAESPGFARALAATLQELRMARIAPAELRTDIMKLREYPALDDLSWLLERFEEQCRQAGIADWPTVLEAAQAAAEQEPARDPVLLLDLPIHTPSERAFLKAYLAVAPEVLVTVPEGDTLTRESVEMLGVVETVSAADGGVSRLDRLRTFLFSPNIPPTPDANDDTAVTFFSAPGEGRECMEIARRILREAKSGVPFDHMAVFTRSPDTYAAVLETALRRAGVPAYFVRGARRPDASGRAFLALLGCAVERLSARAFAEYLSLGQVPRPQEDGSPPSAPPQWVAPQDVREDEAVPELSVSVPEETSTGEAPDETENEIDDDDQPSLDGSLRAPWNWEKLLVEAAVIGGLDRWERRLVGLEFSLRLKIKAVETEEGASPRKTALDRQLRNLRHLRKFALPIVERLAELPASATWGVWLDALGRLAPMALRTPDRVLALLAELRPMSEMGPVTLAEVREVLRARLASLPQDPPESRYGCVLVAPLEQSRGRLFDVVFVPGLSERMFPQKLREDPLMLDELRIALGPFATLASQDMRATRERLLLRLAAGTARQRLYLSYPRMDLATSRSRVPSFYGLDVMRAVTGVVPDYRDLERQATEEAQARLAWPAPSAGSDAVDETEYDLATLYPALQPHATRVKGQANFLLDLNASLARSLRSRYARWESKNWGTSDGLILPDKSPARATLEKHRLTERAYSASALQKFAVCPYQFFLAAILHLEPRPEAEAIAEMDALTRGSLFHRVQARLLRRLLDAQRLPVSQANLASAEREMDEVLNATAAEEAENLAPAIPGVWAAGVETIRADLRGWLRLLADIPTVGNEAWLPAYFEFAFGLTRGGTAESEEQRDPGSVREPVRLAGGQLLRGAVDLIEGLYDPSTNEASALRITDHKTGANRTKENLQFGGGEMLQPSLYALAVENVFPALKVRESVLSYCTATGGFTRRSVRVDDELRQRAAEVLAAIDDAVAFGFLPPAPRKDACGWCDFRAVCGPYEESRWLRKKEARPSMNDLLWLRGLP